MGEARFTSAGILMPYLPSRSRKAGNATGDPKILARRAEWNLPLHHTWILLHDLRLRSFQRVNYDSYMKSAFVLIGNISGVLVAFIGTVLGCSCACCLWSSDCSRRVSLWLLSLPSVCDSLYRKYCLLILLPTLKPAFAQRQGA